MIELAYANTAAPAQNPWMAMIPWIAIFVLMWFMMIRPQQKREKARQKMISELKKGDRVLLVSGFYGRVVRTGEHVFGVEIAKGMTVEVERNAIAALANETAADTAAKIE